jgi:hypothetical protein
MCRALLIAHRLGGVDDTRSLSQPTRSLASVSSHSIWPDTLSFCYVEWYYV